MKTFITMAIFCLAGLVSVQAKTSCDQHLSVIDGAKDYKSMDCLCIGAVRAQIQMEMDASLTYLAMGAHFSQDTVNRPGFANFFFNSASEEREHSMKLIEYLLMRGELVNNLTALISVPAPRAANLNSGKDALTSALKLETQVTESIRQVIAVCEGKDDEKNHYHLVDYLAGDFLDEQYKGQREIAEKITTLTRMVATQGTLGEFLFDKTLL